MIEIFNRFINYYSLQNSRLLLSVSGGVDSMVLLKIASQNLDSKNIFVINIDHNTREETKAEAKLIKEFCEKHSIKFFYESIEVLSVNFEENARNKRLAIYQEYMDKLNLDGVLLAHHRDDRVETFFYNLFKGSFLKGLSSLKPFNRSLRIFRPLIEVSKDEIYEFAKQNNVLFLEDSSNNSDKYSRNYIRLNLLPIIKQRFQNFSKQLTQKIHLFEELDVYLTKNLNLFISNNIVDVQYGKKIFKSDFLSLPSFMQFELLSKLNVKLKSFDHFLELRKSFSSSGLTHDFDSLYIYVSNDHLLFSSLNLSQLSDFYFNQNKKEGYVKLCDVDFDLKYKGKSFKKSKSCKSLAYYFRDGIPVDIKNKQEVKFIVKKI